MGLGLGLGLSLATVGSSSAAAFAPTDLANLKAWYRMDLGATTSSGGTSLDALADQSGTGDAAKNLTKTGTVGYTATDAAYNNRPVAVGTAAGRLEGSGFWAASQAHPYTVYIVGESDTSGGRWMDGDPTGRGLIMNNNGGGGTEWAMYAGTFVESSGGTPEDPAVICAVFNGASSALYVDDPVSAAASGNAGSATLNQAVLMGLGGGGGELPGKLAELILYSGAHDQTTRTQVMAYLATRYGL